MPSSAASISKISSAKGVPEISGQRLRSMEQGRHVSKDLSSWLGKKSALTAVFFGPSATALQEHYTRVSLEGKNKVPLFFQGSRGKGYIYTHTVCIYYIPRPSRGV